MSRITESVEVNVPIRVAYNQWTQFEEFPLFMDAVERVDQATDDRLHWVASIGGQRREWDAVITEQTPDQRVAWRSTSGAENSGCVTFEPLSEGSCRVTVDLDAEPSGVIEWVGSLVGAPAGSVRSDLERFKEFIESRGRETGAWRGMIAD